MNIRRSFAWACLALPAALLFVAANPSCSSSKSPAGLAAGCSLNSDCDNPLVCIFALCHQACEESRDCSDGERCVKVDGTGVCELSTEASCANGKTCEGSLVCGPDQQCRTPCTTQTDCLGGQVCQSNVCYDPSELDGSGSSSGSASSSGGTSSSGGSSSGGDGGGKDGATEGGSSCPSAQTQFGGVATGDANPGFGSGLGIVAPGNIYIFSGYKGADPTGADAGIVSYVYVQAFDPVTGNSKGPAAPFFSTAADPNIAETIDAAAVSPSGEIALLYGTNTTGLWATFLEPGGDAGTATAGLTVLKTFQIATSVYRQPFAAWDSASQSFVFTYKYTGTTGPARVQKYLPNGNSAGGSTDPVPTDQTSAVMSTYGNTSVGYSNGVYGVGFVNSGGNYPAFTVLDGQGNQVGTTTLLEQAFSTTWSTLSGTSTGFVSFLDTGTTVAEVLVPVAADGGVAAPSGDAGSEYAGFTVAGAKRAAYAVAAEDYAGVGGVGVGILYPDGLSFAYVNADGITHVGPASLVSHAYDPNGDYMHANNWNGSFGVSLFEIDDHQTVALASGCTP
ncbi:MAG TPA: hypothetical protein VGG39_07185 [Polyangiaceae bacterium]|jgi:hypothetical protein